MATKTISITEDAYLRLSAFKAKNDSFSDVITKHFPKHSLLEIASVLTKEEADELRKHIKSRRATSRKRIEKISDRLK